MVTWIKSWKLFIIMISCNRSILVHSRGTGISGLDFLLLILLPNSISVHVFVHPCTMYSVDDFPRSSAAMHFVCGFSTSSKTSKFVWKLCSINLPCFKKRDLVLLILFVGFLIFVLISVVQDWIYALVYVEFTMIRKAS